MPYKREEILKKYNKLEQDGKNAIEKGTITPFVGFDVSFKRRMNVSFLPDQKTIDSIVERILMPLQSVAQRLGMGIFKASVDYPIHITVQEAVYEGSDNFDAKEMFESIRGSVIPIELREGCVFKLERLIMDGAGNVILATETIDDAVCSARNLLVEAFSEQGLKPLPIDNILHSVMSRIRKFPEDESEINYCIWEFSQQVEKIKSEIRCKPIDFCIGEIYTGNSLDLLNK